MDNNWDNREVKNLMRKSGLLAVVFSFVLIGLGQVYTGKYLRAFGFFSGAVFLGFTILGILLIPLLYLWAIIDSYLLVVKYNEKIEKINIEVVKNE